MSVIATTTVGKVEGFEKDGINVFLGIPFAAPPIGNLRWLPPQPVQPWEGVKETKAFVSIAPQNVAAPNPAQPATTVGASLGTQPAPNEDCLYLNIWTPGLDNARRPVMFWIHGGAFTSGTGASPRVDRGKLANRGDVVVVSINYRVNVFGCLRLKDVTQGKIPSTGNEGILDQIAALKWVHDNISVFGGDPENVTIFGASAGGASVCALLGIPAAKGLFHKAISQSGSAHFLSEQDEASLYTEHLLGVLGIKGSDVDSLLGLTMEEILQAYRKSLPVPKGIRSPMPVIDGELFHTLPINNIKVGSADGIPLLAGTTADEWRTWQVRDTSINDLVDGRMLGRFRRMMPDWDMTEAVEAYRQVLDQRGVANTPSEIYLAVMTARMFWIPTLRTLEAHERRGNPSYCYMFTLKSPARGGMLGAHHGIDVGFLWGNYQAELYGSNPEVSNLSRSMQDAWLAFARTGDPSCEGLGQWPIYGEHRETMLLREKCEVQEAPLEDERCIWDSAPDKVFKWGIA